LAGLIKVALGVTLVVGAVGGVAYINAQLERQGSLEPSRPSIDYNGDLPGCGSPWLMQSLGDCSRSGQGIYGECEPSSDYCLRGWFDVSPYDGLPDLYVPISLDDEGCVASWAEVYQTVGRVHPQLGGGGLTPMTAGELEDTNRVSSEWYVAPGFSADDERGTYLLPWLSEATLERLGKDDGVAVCAPTSAPGPPAVPRAPTPSRSTRSPSPSPTATPETRRYRVTVSGYEVVDRVRPDNARASVTATARFTYQLQGRFTIVKHRRLWNLQGARITSADVQVSVTLSPPECWSQSKQTTRYFARLRQKQSLKGLVSSHGDGSWDVQLIWGHLLPGVRVDAVVSADATCGGSGYSVPYDFQSQLFFEWLNGELLELQDRDRFETTGGVSNHGKRIVDYKITVVRLKP
jgi:hypothetical protein